MTYGSGTVLMPIFRRTLIGACGFIAVYVTYDLAVKPIYAYTTTKISNVGLRLATLDIQMRKEKKHDTAGAHAPGGH
ncbi:hypothetical protein Esti_006265 [Eimeria stiedai]